MMFGIYKETPDGEYLAVDITGLQSDKEIRVKLPPDTNWYEIEAGSAMEATEKAAKEKPNLYLAPELRRILLTGLKKEVTHKSSL